jgi:hypothetical protein
MAEEMAQLVALRDAERAAAAERAAGEAARAAVVAAADAAAAGAAGDAGEVEALRGELAQLAHDVAFTQAQVAAGPPYAEDDDDLDEPHAPVPDAGGASNRGSAGGGSSADIATWFAAAGDVTPKEAVAAALAAHPGMDPEAEAGTLLRQRAALLGSGRYTRADAAVRRVEACIEELWREAERRKGIYRDD